MQEKIALVVTSIAAPNAPLSDLANGCRKHGFEFIVIGDEASPPGFELEGCRFYSLSEQRELGFRFAVECPTKNYARKNIGYLLAARSGASVLIETDDDNHPRPEFWEKRQRRQSAKVISHPGWVNTYRYFTGENIWPRGLPLEQIHASIPPYEGLELQEIDCPIQQGLVDENPDVDAIYRLALPLPQTFQKDRRVALVQNAWCPFNSQNTTWWRDAFPILYLPAYCSMRLSDIWRSFVAQSIAWANDWAVLFHGPTIWQERNAHNVMLDFKDEVPGYLHNADICAALAKLSLRPGLDHLNDNLRVSYEELVRMGLIGKQELNLLEAWIADLNDIPKPN